MWCIAIPSVRLIRTGQFPTKVAKALAPLPDTGSRFFAIAHHPKIPQRRTQET